MTKRRVGRLRKFVESETLDVITDVFWQHGLEGTSLDALSEATGVARPSLYATFGDKEAMYLAAIRNFLARIDAAMTPVAQRTAPLENILIEMFDVLIGLYAGEGARGCLIVCTAATEAVAHDAVREELEAVLSRVDARFEQLLSRARESGHLRVDVELGPLARLLAGVTHTIAIRARAGESPERLREIAAAAVALVGSGG